MTDNSIVERLSLLWLRVQGSSGQRSKCGCPQPLQEIASKTAVWSHITSPKVKGLPSLGQEPHTLGLDLGFDLGSSSGSRNLGVDSFWMGMHLYWGDPEVHGREAGRLRGKEGGKKWEHPQACNSLEEDEQQSSETCYLHKKKKTSIDLGVGPWLRASVIFWDLKLKSEGAAFLGNMQGGQLLKKYL